MVETAIRMGTGAGGTRNIAGTSHPLVELERELADLHGKEAALVFTSGYVSNQTGIATIARLMSGGVILSDAICAAATAAIRHLKSSNWEREQHQHRTARTKAVLRTAGLPVMPSETHIIPVLVGHPEQCKEASDLLLTELGIYIQPINYPTVPRGMERLRITPSPCRDDGMTDALAKALIDVWERLNLPRENRALAHMSA
jgi:5-aminolevulinate synthase